MALRDLAFAGRTLRKSPVFALTAILTIALGVGASTAIFSVTNAVLLRPLPYQDPARLVIATSDMRNRNVREFPFSNAAFIDWRDSRCPGFRGRLYRPQRPSDRGWHARASPPGGGHHKFLSAGGRQDGVGPGIHRRGRYSPPRSHS